MHNTYSPTEDKTNDAAKDETKKIENFEMPHFFEEEIDQTDEKDSDVNDEKIKAAVFDNFDGLEPVKNDNVVSEYEIPDFSTSVSELISRMQQQNQEQGEEGQEEQNLENVEKMLSNYERENHLKKNAEEITEKAKQEAAMIVVRANKDAETILEEAKTEGFKMGYADGLLQGKEDGAQKGYQETSALALEKLTELLNEIKTDIETLQETRDKIFEEQIPEMRDLSISIAEKVLNVSLKSSTEIIEKMITGAVEKIKNEKWAKIYLSQMDFDISAKADLAILNSVKKIAETVKIEVVDNKPSGTCIIELPDTIIDASVDTQIEQISKLLGKI